MNRWVNRKLKQQLPIIPNKLPRRLLPKPHPVLALSATHPTTTAHNPCPVGSSPGSPAVGADGTGRRRSAPDALQGRSPADRCRQARGRRPEGGGRVCRSEAGEYKIMTVWHEKTIYFI